MSISIRNMNWVMGMRELNTQTAHDAMMSNLLAIMDALTLAEYDAFVDAGPDGNAEFAQYVAAKRAEIEAQKALDCGKVGQPLTPQQVRNIRKQYTEFRANGGTHSDLE